MSVRVVIGKAGSGKSHRCFRAIVEACAADPLGPPIYWIVPKQATFQTERDLTCAQNSAASAAPASSPSNHWAKTFSKNAAAQPSPKSPPWAAR